MYKQSFRTTNNFQGDRFKPGQTYKNVRTTDAQNEDAQNESTDVSKSAIELKVEVRKPVDADHFLEPTLSRSMQILTNRQEVMDKLHRDKKMDMGNGFKTDNVLLGRAANKLNEELTTINDNENKRYDFELSGRNKNVMSTTQGITTFKYVSNEN